ncbi:MAG TPA: secondary thiamine-phosphate synthase enzyme YjbQ [Acidobacteriota bacterium]|nr:secondary thiamine-phosphate synthase enzyme YjbQ [Acidobacteriota bacterium]
MHSASIEVATRGQELYDITAELRRAVAESGVADGLAVVFVRHTSASLVVQENADPRVRRDLLDFFARLVPEDAGYAHDDEGPDDMPSHIRTALTHTSEIVPVADGAPLLGAWQALYLFEHRRAPHRRRVEIRVFGD